MKEHFFKVTLLSDVILNSSLATEGSMTTLDFIPGSNFLGIAAAKLYKDSSEENFDLFHSGKVKFGDAYLSIDGKLSYPMPYSLYCDKLNNNIYNDDLYLHHLVNDNNVPKDGTTRLQLKQVRAGYFNISGTHVKIVDNNISIKSARERSTGTSKDGAMFGFSSLTSGLEFIFSIRYDESVNIEKICSALEGEHRLGKSKNAEFGQVIIERKNNSINDLSSFISNDYLLVYAQSNLCFFDENGLPTFKPTPVQLGLDNDAVIDWTKSQIRTHSYTTWNYKRNTTNTLRYCITKGSVFFVKNCIKNELYNTVGEFQSEGLGRVIYNPSFLDGELVTAKSKFSFKSRLEEPKKEPNPNYTTILTKYLKKQSELSKFEKDLSSKIVELINQKSTEKLKKISPSQWGNIRTLAIKAKSMDELYKTLFDEKNGYLSHGVANEKYWGKNKNANLKLFDNIFNDNIGFGKEFIAKFAAEMAKESKSTKN